VEADIIGKSYEPSGASQTAPQGSPKGKRGGAYQYLIRKFAEGGRQSAGEWSGATWTAIGRPEGERGGAHQFYTPPEVGTIMSKVLQPEPGMEIYDPTCGSGGLLIKCEIAMEEAAKGKKRTIAPLKLYGQDRWAWGAYLRRVQRARRLRQRRNLPHQFVADSRM
jgi:type I restriction-modification system DNA methylase subunit